MQQPKDTRLRQEAAQLVHAPEHTATLQGWLGATLAQETKHTLNTHQKLNICCNKALARRWAYTAPIPHFPNLERLSTPKLVSAPPFLSGRQRGFAGNRWIKRRPSSPRGWQLKGRVDDRRSYRPMDGRPGGGRTREGEGIGGLSPTCSLVWRNYTANHTREWL